LIDQVAKATRWEKGIRALGDVALFVEIGPGRTLSGMNKKIGVAGMTVNVEKITDLEQFYAAST
jgi:[acyl-carrier-protein] S-malonyltransferase